MELVNVDKTPYIRQLKKLYKESFPKAEKKPFWMMRKKCREGTMEMFALSENGDTFVGLAIFIYFRDMVLLDYFAIELSFRGMGKGSKALELIKEKFKHKRFFLEIESIYEDCPDIKNRQNRRKFYMANGMMSQNYLVSLFGTQMEVLSAGAAIRYEEYETMYRELFSKRVARKHIHFLRNVL